MPRPPPPPGSPRARRAPPPGPPPGPTATSAAGGETPGAAGWGRAGGERRLRSAPLRPAGAPHRPDTELPGAEALPLARRRGKWLGGGGGRRLFWECLGIEGRSDRADGSFLSLWWKGQAAAGALSAGKLQC
ncbi:vasodilator-stimulated phosphoprotein-like [Poecile atricapillus]|uniref:vasodilator-stimulated phosphoprotein-like n=1 Tax=Poecile atricapillus TaxID=48891 RepID=UPI00273889A4|nr:vasodilator-stimulated phosphoprotein-like [Poecile atricapillus]